MAEYIEREALCEACGESIVKCNLCVAKEIPAADVVEVVHGRWIDGAESFGAKRGTFRVCSRCNTCFPRDDRIVPPSRWRGCPACFARMDGEC